MKIICLVKFVPDVEGFTYDPERQQLVRENVRTILNLDDASALAVALRLKKAYGAQVELVTMGPASVMGKLRDPIRIGVDKAVLITDSAYAGSDTYATSRILGKYLMKARPDIVFTGTHTIDGDTAHVPAQIAEIADYSFMSGITKIEDACVEDGKIICSVETDESICKYALELPAVLGISRDSKYKPPFVSYADLDKYVDDKIQVISNEELGLAREEIGTAGSKTRVMVSYPRMFPVRKQTIVQTDEEGIEYVYNFLKEKGFINGKESDDISG